MKTIAWKCENLSYWVKYLSSTTAWYLPKNVNCIWVSTKKHKSNNWVGSYGSGE